MAYDRRPRGREIKGAGAALIYVALMLLCIAFVLCAVSFCAPFWVTHRTEYYDMGLWGKCFFNPEKAGRDGCRWMWDFDWALENAMSSWFKGVQALFGFGILFLLTAFIVALGQLCCDLGFGSSKTFSILGGIVLFAWVLMTIAIVTFGVMDYLENSTSVNSQIKRFSWAYIVGITGIVVSCCTAIIYFVTDCVITNDRKQEGYKMSLAELRGE